MKTLCCSNKCERRFECARADINNEGLHCVEDFSSFGAGTLTNNGYEIEYWCGKEGNYKMFDPMDSYGGYMERFFNGELNWDDALNYSTSAFMKHIDILVKQDLQI